MAAGVAQTSFVGAVAARSGKDLSAAHGLYPMQELERVNLMCVSYWKGLC
jgi:hypothetical protein